MSERKYKVTDDAAPWYHIDTSMISSKMSYFFQNAKDSCYLPYMILFLTSIGLTPTQAGMVNGLRFLGFIVGAPLWGILADYKRVHRLIIFILCFASFLLISSQPFLSIPMTATENQVCNAKVNGTQASMNLTLDVHQTDTSDGGNSKLFATLMVINIIASCFDGSTQGFVDSGVIQKTIIRKTDFGRQRLFGAVGFGFGAFASSLADQYFPKSYFPCYSSVFIIYGISMLCLAIFTNILFKSLTFLADKRKRQNSTVSITSNFYGSNTDLRVGQLLRKTVCELNTLFFLATVLIIGTIHAIYLGFLFILLKEIECPKIVMGLSLVVGSVASATCIGLCENFIKWFGGTIRVLAFGCFTWALRFILFFYMQNPWLVLPIQILQGVGYGLFIASSVVHIKSISKPNIYTSMYGIFNGLFFGLGAVLGNVIGGSLLMKFGIRSLFLGTSLVGFVWTFIMLVYLVYKSHMRKYETGDASEEEQIELSKPTRFNKEL